MNKREIGWVFPAATVTGFALICIAPSLLPPAKAPACHIQAVNNIANIFITMPSTNAHPGARTNK